MHAESYVMKLQFRLEAPHQERLRAKERVLGRRVLPLSSSIASFSRRPQVASATLRDLTGIAANSVQFPKVLRHCAEVERCHQELCPSRPFLRDSGPLDSEYVHRTVQLAIRGKPLPVGGGALLEPGGLLPLFWALRPFRGEEQGTTNLMKVDTTDRHGGRRCDRPHLEVPSLVIEARYRVCVHKHTHIHKTTGLKS